MKGLQEEQMYHHFSHNHPMVRTTCSISTGNINCSGCKLGIYSGKGYYTCKTCPFYLHQVCYNMPRKTRHPSHPDHLLTLQFVSSSSDETLECKACGHRVDGVYYNCAECCICYHILCSVLPLSVSINSHFHSLKLEFSPPRDLQCDICKILACKGWLYRCQICEFDAHLACAISNQRTRSFRHPTAPFLDSSTRKIKPCSTLLMETNEREDYVNEGTELMQLVSLGLNIRSSTKPDIASISPSPIAQDSDQLSLLSSDLSAGQSYQFSDGCFSIDLAGSYSSFDVKSQARNESKLSGTTPLGKVTVEKNNIMLDRITSNFEPKEQEIIYVKKSVPGIGNQSNKSASGRSDCSCWPNLFQS